jgi:BioD-like phosphotransacetylase family protein
MASTRRGAGKTGIIAGIVAALKLKAGYMKPMGDRLLYQKKRLWDYDAALMARLWSLKEDPENMTLGFEQAKLRFMYDTPALKKRLEETAKTMESGKDVLFIEGGPDLAFGSSVNLDADAVARMLGAKLVLVLGGTDDQVSDDLAFVKAHVEATGTPVAGVIINRVQDPDDFRATRLGGLSGSGIKVLGVLPHRPELSRISVGFVADRLFAKVLSGESGMNTLVKNVLVGSIGSEAALREAFKKERMLIVTSGDRSDVILAAMEADTAGMVLTNDMLPPSSVIARAAEKNLPLLLVPHDTHEAVRQIDALEPLLTAGDADKTALLEGDIRVGVDLKALLPG